MPMTRTFRRLLFLSLAFLAPSLRAADDACVTSGRPAAVCRDMRVIRSYLLLLEHQRDLNLVNYPALASYGKDAVAVLDGLLAAAPDGVHTDAWKSLRASFAEMASFAGQNSFEAFRNINTLRPTCGACHGPNMTAGATPILPKEVLDVCHAPGKNPFVCKHMHGMKNHVAFFADAAQASRVDAPTTVAAARELERLAATLEPIGNQVHMDGREIFGSVLSLARSLRQQAQAHDLAMVDTAKAINDQCARCHRGH